MGVVINELGINLGYACNFRCAHCSVENDRAIKLSPREVSMLTRVINKHKFKSLLLVGGEPTLYVDIANRILSGCRQLSDISVRVTTNGHFADTVDNAVKVLGSFRKLDKVQLSYDKFHAEFLPFERIGNLFSACRKLKKQFSVVLTIASPLDIVLAEKIRHAGRFFIGIQKVLSIGKAKVNGISHPFPSFDEKVLLRGCPNKGRIMYFCGQGFSTCCSTLVFESKRAGIIHGTIEEHLDSQFYRTFVRSRFGSLVKKLGIMPNALRPEHSAICNLCDHVFDIMEKRGYLDPLPLI